jgi:choline dehydrogenase-like flavoprotein
MLAAPARLAHFSTPEALTAIGYPVVETQDREPPPRWMEGVTAASALDAHSEFEADVVVIGSGAGGGAIAAALAEKGFGTVVLEEGAFLRRADFSGDVVSRMRRSWRDYGVTGTIGRPPILVPLGKVVGGTTTINSGTCYRTPDLVLEEWRNAGLSDDFTPERFGPYLDQVENELAVALAEKDVLGKVADVVARGAEALGLPHGPLPRNAPGCDGQGTCIFGCPTGAKRSSDVSWIPRALTAGAALFTGLSARRLLMREGRVVAVEARGTDDSGAEKRLHIRARTVVVACGTFISPLLLWENGIHLPWMGRNLSVHPAMGMWLTTDHRLDPWQAIPQSYGVEGPDGIRFEGVYLPPPLAAALLPVPPEELNRWVDGEGKVAQYGFMVRDDSVGRVRRGPAGRPLATYELSDRSRRRLQTGATLLAEMLIRGGAREVLPGIAGISPIRTVEEARALATRRISPTAYRLLGAHPLGTCRMGPTRDSGVVDFDHRVFGTDNLYIADGSVVPTSLGVNPQVTIMAMALRAADRIAARLS